MHNGNKAGFLLRILIPIIKIFLKPIVNKAHINPLFHDYQNHLEEEFEGISEYSQKFIIEVGDKEIEFSRGKWTVYLPWSEFVKGPTEKRKSIIIQAYTKTVLLPDLVFVDKEFHDALCIYASRTYIEKNDPKRNWARQYAEQVYEKNKQNKNIDFVSTYSETNKLKELVTTISSQLMKDKDKITTIKVQKRIRKIIQKERQKYKKTEISEDDINKLSDKELLSRTPKDIFDMTRMYDAKKVAKCVARNEVIKTRQGKKLSYVEIAKVVIQYPGISYGGIAQKMGKPSSPYIRYGLVALLGDHKNGLNLVKRIKKEHNYEIYPTYTFLLLLKKYNYKFVQKLLDDYPT